MPLKGSNKKEYQREYMKRKRSNTDQGNTGTNSKENVLPEMFEGKPRYLTLSDRQVLDRTYQPEPNKHIPEMIAANRVNETRLGSGLDVEKAAKLLMIANSLNRDYIALDGKKGKLSDLVRYGIDGLTMTQVKERLE